jgi:hypothetical protein
MPELPEVEVTRLSFADRIAGARVTGVRVGKPLRWALGCEPESLVGRQVQGVRRRGKYLLVDMDEGLLLWHLGMSGSLMFSNDRSAPRVHDHFDLDTTQGLLRLNDPRRFGAVVFAPSEQSAEAVKLLGHLGVEPLNGGFALDAFHLGLRKRETAIKQVLLGGELVAFALARFDTGLACWMIDGFYVAPAYRDGWATLWLRYELIQTGLRLGRSKYYRVRARNDHTNTVAFARRLGAQTQGQRYLMEASPLA